MTSQYRHRRSSVSSATFPTLEPGEISVNTANRQIAVGDAAAGTTGQPKNLLALRYFDVSAQYVANDYVANAAGVIYRANKPTGPGAFVPADWNMMVGQIDPQYVAKAGDTMTGMLTLPATAPSAGQHATNKTYVDTQDAALKTYVDSQNTALTGAKVDRAGDVMSGMLTLPVTAPSIGQHATNKTYVDGMIAAKSSVLTADSPPAGAPDNTLWVETDSGRMFVKINDGNSSQWVQVVAGSAQSQIKKNYVINGAMQISQENGTTAGSAAVFYPADQFQGTWAGTSGVYTAAQVAVSTPGGSSARIRFIATTADAAVGAGDIVFIQQVLEGLRVADLRFGSAAAKTITLQFGVKAPAGTYCVALLNGATNRSYIAEYVIAAGEANTDVVKSVTVSGDTTGTWSVDNTVGIVIRWGLMAGTTFQQVAGSWGTVNAIGSANQFNFMGTVNNVFELFDVSFTEGSIAPPFQVPDYASELALCKRYVLKLTGFAVVAPGPIQEIVFPVSMRALPTITGGGAGFAISSGNTEHVCISQTTQAFQSLLMNARL